MICPYCNKEMIEGYIEADGRCPLIWRCKGEKKNLDALIEQHIFKENLLAPKPAIPFNKIHLSSYKCEDCGIILIKEEVF